MSYTCENCGESFDRPIIEDEGIGFYDYGGAGGRDVRIVAYTPCCESEFTEEVYGEYEDFYDDYDGYDDYDSYSF